MMTQHKNSRISYATLSLLLLALRISSSSSSSSSSSATTSMFSQQKGSFLPLLPRKHKYTAAQLLARNNVNDADDNGENDESLTTALLRSNKLHGGDIAATTTSSSGGGGTSSLTTSIFNLVNNVAGAGMLTLSSGMAKGSSTGYIPAVFICLLFGCISGHTFNLVGKSCELTGEHTFKGIWSRTIGKSTTYVVDSIIALQCLASCVIYSGILGDLSTSLISAYKLLPTKYNLRTLNILFITTLVLFPLGLIKNLSALGFTSILGLISVLYTVCFIVFRSLDGSYDILNHGQFILSTDSSSVSSSASNMLQPSFEKTSLMNFGLSSLVLASTFSLSFFAHYNSPVYHRELKQNTAKRFTKMVIFSYCILITLYTTTMLAGYNTFGDVCQGNILLNYHPNDLLSNFGQVATFFSIVFGFPLVLRGVRESAIGVLNAFGLYSISSTSLVFGLLALITIISVNVNDVSLVVGLSGATCGCFLVFICPVILYVRSMGLVHGWDSEGYSKAKLNLLLIPFGLCIGALGVFSTLK